jgi:hypothetical protein
MKSCTGSGRGWTGTVQGEYIEQDIGPPEPAAM